MEQIATLLLYSDYHSLPVVEDGRLVGIISRSDLIRVAMKLNEDEGVAYE
jgi:CBS-domain-containing membrane protein